MCQWPTALYHKIINVKQFIRDSFCSWVHIRESVWNAFYNRTFQYFSMCSLLFVLHRAALVQNKYKKNNIQLPTSVSAKSNLSRWLDTKSRHQSYLSRTPPRGWAIDDWTKCTRPLYLRQFCPASFQGRVDWSTIKLQISQKESPSTSLFHVSDMLLYFETRGPQRPNFALVLVKVRDGWVKFPSRWTYLKQIIYAHASCLKFPI